MTRFTSLLRASLVVVVVVIVSILCSSDAAITQYVSPASILGRCANFSIQGGTTVTFDGVTTNVFSGNVGCAPGTSITGAPVLGTGYSLEVNTSPAINCAADEMTAYLYFEGLTCSHTLANTDLSGQTMLPGVYCSASGLTLSDTPLYLDAQGDSCAQFIFQLATTLNTAANTQIILLNGAQARNVYWQIGTAATLGASSSFIGQVLAGTSIHVAVSVTVIGRLFSQTAVTFAGTDQITLPA